MFEWSAVIEGIRPISKKNSRRNFRNRSLPSVAHEKFHAEAFPIIYQQRPSTPLTGATVAIIHVYLKGRLDIDWDNVGASWCDLLQDAGVIENDAQIRMGTVIKHPGSADWRSEIHLLNWDDVIKEPDELLSLILQ